jgi:hypothetical protein
MPCRHLTQTGSIEVSISLGRRSDLGGLVSCSGCQMYGEPLTLFNRIGGPTGVVHHLIDHIAAGQTPDRWTVIVVRNWIKHDIFREFKEQAK